MKYKAFLSLGSNIGDKEKNLETGIDFLTENNNVELINSSRIYETEPIYNKNQEKFYNQTIKIRTVLSPAELLGFIKLIELKSGRRISHDRNMPRTLDIDILTVDYIVMDSPGLVLPHPYLRERKFVLQPWAEIAPDYEVPNLNKSVQELLNTTEDISEVMLLEVDKIATI